MFLSLKTLYRKRTVIWPFYFYTIIRTLSGKAIIAFILSVGVGTWLSFFNHGIGVVVSISIIGAFLIYQNENKKDE